MQNMQTVIAPTRDVARAFSVRQFPSITLMRLQDDHNITFPGEPAKATVKSLMDFVERNIKAKYELMISFQDQGDDVFFAALFDTADRAQSALAREILDRVAQDHPDAFKIRYGDAPQLRRNLTDLNLQNWSTPLFLFAKKDNCGYHKWVYSGKLNPMAVSAFCADQLRGRNTETIVSSPIERRVKTAGLKFLTGAQLAHGLVKNARKDYVVNFVGFPCVNCADVDRLFDETAVWATHNGIRSVVFARVNASCNDVPTTVWRNETFPYGWFFPAKNRTAAFPIGKRRQLYWMAHLLKDNMTEPFEGDLPTKPEKTPYVKREDL
jgi:hypothetical protein